MKNNYEEKNPIAETIKKDVFGGDNNTLDVNNLIKLCLTGAFLALFVYIYLKYWIKVI